MRKAVIAGVLVSAFALGAATQGAAALPIAPLGALNAVPPMSDLQTIGYRCRCGWGHREYWRWDHRPVWDDPWRVLRPTIWGSPEPHLVPAEIWVRKWHLPRRYWRPRYRLHRW